jgi:transposase
MSKYSVKLSEAQHKSLEHVVQSGSAPARKIMHAQILLKADKGPQGAHWSDKRIRETFGVGERMIREVRKRCVTQGLEAALNRRRQPERPEKRKIDGKQEAQIIALLCSEQPEGAERWTLRALTDRVVELELVESVSHETVRTVLKKNELKPWQKQQWCTGPTGEANYVYHMEDVLEVYVRPYDERFPQVCLDEGGYQFIRETRDPLPMQPGQVKREDYEYEPEGFCSVFLACEPLTGKRFVQARERRTKADFAYFVRELIDGHYREAEKIVLVMDNLNIHTPGSLYEVFSPHEAMRLWKKLEIHSTPRHGSWLNMAEIELSVLARQALSGRLADLESVQQRLAAWQAKRNERHITIDWRFTAQDARIKLKRLYPSIAVDHALSQERSIEG